MRFVRIILSTLLLSGCRSGPTGDAEAVRRGVPPPVRRQQIFLVMDDAGLALDETMRFLEIPVPMTIAVLPHLKETEAVCAAIRRHADKEIILHQPMEAYNRESNIGAGGIRSTTPPQAVAAVLDRNLASVRGAVGINNHMGSLVTESEVIMTAVLRHCRTRGIFFLDSKTSYNSMVPRVAAREQMHVEQRDVFLDIRRDRESVRRAWESAVRKAREQGAVIVIGHVWSEETAAAIRDSYASLLNQGYTFHLLSELYE